MIPANRWLLREDADPRPAPRRGPVPTTGAYRVGTVRTRSLTAAALEVLRAGSVIEVRTPDGWRAWSDRA